MTTRNDRIAGVLLAQACGDALGTHYETGTPSHGHAQMLGGGYGFEPGEYSDPNPRVERCRLSTTE